MSYIPKVIILGAGASGIAVATKLLENGFGDVTILEAENRIGGRIHSVEFDGTVIDLGAQWVHGEEGNIVYQMVKDLDLLKPSFNSYEETTFCLSSGEVPNNLVYDELYKIGLDVISDEEDALRHPGPFGDYFNKVFTERVLQQYGNNREIFEIVKLLKEWFSKFYVCLDPAETWFDLTTGGANAFAHCEGNQQLNWRNGGFRSIFDIMMKKIPENTNTLTLIEKILLNKEVTNIKWDDVTNKVTIQCTDGTSYIADHVIVTLSVGVLKKNHTTLFTPALPHFKVNSIEGIALGTVNKILLRFPSTWWSRKSKGFSFLWTENDKLNLRNETFHYEPSKDGRSWLEDVFGFYVIDSHPRVLLGWVVGRNATQVELLSDEVVMESCMFLLRKFLGHEYDIPDADSIKRSKWGTNPHFYGSYVYVSNEAELRNASAEDLGRPLASKCGKETLLFAGEATNPTRYSTVHGAIETGYREADRLISIYKNPIRTNIVIVGAGMAGLGAALELQRLNVGDYLIIEAQNEPGGRIRTINIDGKPLELGAQWIHGKDNPLYQMAAKHNLIADVTGEALGKFYYNDGSMLNESVVKQVDWEVGVILERCQTFIDKNNYPKSVGEFLETEFNKYIDSCDDSVTKGLMRELLDWHIRFLAIDNSCNSLYRLSAKSWGTYICLDEAPYYNIKGGYKSLIDLIINDIPQEKLLYKTPVTAIHHDNSQILLSCGNRFIVCNHLILTCSLGVLKGSNISPPLPEMVKKSINAMGYDAIAKIFLFFKDRWWGEEKGFQFVWKADAVVEKKERWARHITGFDEVSNHPNALIGWLGNGGVQTMEELDKEEVGDVCVRLLRRFLKDYDISKPVKVIRTKWCSHPWIKGGYCHVTPECDRSGLGISTLQEPVYIDDVPRIFLAGEAVHPSHYSTTHGAFESGQNQASVLAEYLCKNQ